MRITIRFLPEIQSRGRQLLPPVVSGLECRSLLDGTMPTEDGCEAPNATLGGTISGEEPFRHSGEQHNLVELELEP